MIHVDLKIILAHKVMHMKNVYVRVCVCVCAVAQACVDCDVCIKCDGNVI